MAFLFMCHALNHNCLKICSCDFSCPIHCLLLWKSLLSPFLHQLARLFINIASQESGVSFLKRTVYPLIISSHHYSAVWMIDSGCWELWDWLVIFFTWSQWSIFKHVMCLGYSRPTIFYVRFSLGLTLTSQREELNLNALMNRTLVSGHLRISWYSTCLFGCVKRQCLCFVLFASLFCYLL